MITTIDLSGTRMHGLNPCSEKQQDGSWLNGRMALHCDNNDWAALLTYASASAAADDSCPRCDALVHADVIPEADVATLLSTLN